MTHEETALEIVEFFEEQPGSHRRAVMEDMIIAALRERDHQWRKAVHQGMERIGSSAIMYAPALYELLKEEP